MKFKKFAAILLAAAISLSAFAACDDSSSSKKKSHKDKEKIEKDEDEDEEDDDDDEKETEESETSETTEIEETTEPTETTEETEPDEPEFLGYGFTTESEGDKYCYDMFMEFIDEYEKANPGSKYAFATYAEPCDFPWNLLILDETSDESVFEAYGIIDGKVSDLSSTYWFSDSAITYESIKALPILIETSGPECCSDLEDGTYFGDLIAFTEDGTKALLVIGSPIILSSEQYESLENDTPLLDINGNDTGFIVTIDDNGVLFDDAMWFNGLPDGTYLLVTDSDYTITYDRKYVILDIAEDADIVDTFSYLYDDGDFTPSSDKTNAFTRTSFYFYATEDEYTSFYSTTYNGWVTYGAIVEPITVEDGTITQMHLGWR